MASPTHQHQPKTRSKSHITNPTVKPKLVESTNALSSTNFYTKYLPNQIQLHRKLEQKLTSSPSSSSSSSPSEKVIEVLFEDAAGLQSTNYFESCLKLIEETSAADYVSSGKGWSESRKRVEMGLRDMKYIVILETPHTWATATATVTATSSSSTSTSGTKVQNNDNDDNTNTSSPQTSKSEATTVAGFISFMITYEDGFEVLYIYEIHVAAHHQSKGLGRILLDAIESIGKRLGIVKVMLTCFRANVRAMGWYERLGYEIDEYSPAPKRLRNGTVKMPSYLILSKGLREKKTEDDSDGVDENG